MNQLNEHLDSDNAIVEEIRKSTSGLESELDKWASKLNVKNEQQFKRDAQMELKPTTTSGTSTVIERLRDIDSHVTVADTTANYVKECNEKIKAVEEQMSQSLSAREQAGAALAKKFSRLIEGAKTALLKMERLKPDVDCMSQHEELSEAVFDGVEEQLGHVNTQLDTLRRHLLSMQSANEEEAARQREESADISKRRVAMNIDDLRKEIALLEEQEGDVLSRIKEYEEKQEEVVKTIDEMGLEIECHAQEMASLQAELAALKEDDAKLDAECNDLLKRKESLQNELSDFVSTANEKIIAFEREQQEIAIAKRNELMERKEAMHQKVFETQKECYQYEEMLNKLKAQLFRQGVDPGTVTLEGLGEKTEASTTKAKEIAAEVEAIKERTDSIKKQVAEKVSLS